MKPLAFSLLPAFVKMVNTGAPFHPTVTDCLQNPPRALNPADLPLAWLTMSRMPAPAKNQTPEFLTMEYEITLTIAVELKDSGLGAPQQHDAILWWFIPPAIVLKKHQRLGDATGTIQYIGRPGAGGSIGEPKAVLIPYNKLEFVGVEWTIPVAERYFAPTGI